MNKPLRILYAEDDILLNELTTELLRGEGFYCTSVHNGVEAQQVLQKEDFDLLLTDLQMPKMDGADLLLWCRKHDFHFPVIFVTGNPEQIEAGITALKDCCTSILAKPLSFDDLLKAIENTMARSHEFDCTPGPETEFPGQHRPLRALTTS